MKHLLGATALFFSILTGCANTSSEKETLYQVKTDTHLSAITNYTKNFTIGIEDRKTPLQIAWSVGKDQDGCLKITDIKVDRVGGDPKLIISNVKHEFLPDCAMEWQSNDDTRFQIAVIALEYQTTIGIKKYSSKGAIATIQGNGKMIDHKK
ncbi:outer membrane biogenesis lipoprotein LolB [Pseudomonas migulae]|uniref:hypothetical protein n=1 Tax=Pseudomonas migulae TaxID=78543 RepID=UPI00209D6405|nr:hypothetical protein [Pseudomonas migulae]MCP1496680.1 outer membrane biogenesis lipoprotein LolB [Pseudomonas migulae]